jgi:catechol 2,3-dioxygenase-like lactoylglutathione lyase family enzyme
LAIRFDHTIVPSRDKEASAAFFTMIFGFKDLGEQDDGLRGLRVNASTVLFFEKSTDSDSSPWCQGFHHLAFAVDERKFARVFSRIKSKGIPYGDTYSTPTMEGPGKAPGARGSGRTIYLKDPSDNLIQIIHY